MVSDQSNSQEFVAQPDGSSGFYELQADGTYIYHQKTAEGAYGYYQPNADGTQEYFRQQPDGSFVQWPRNADGTYEIPLEAEIVVDAEIVEDEPAVPVISPAPSGDELPPSAGAPAPPVSAPVVPYLAPGEQVPAAKKSKKGLLIGGIAAGAVLLLGAGVVGAVTLLKGGDHSATSYVADFAEEPVESWTFGYSMGGAEEFVSAPQVFAIGEQHLLVVPQFDSYGFESANSGGNSWDWETVWYEGYDAQYDQGWDAAQDYYAALDAYDVAYDAWQDEYDLYWENWTWEDDWNAPEFDLEYPYMDEFWPGESDYDDVDVASEGGLQDGFLDGIYDEAYGSNRLSKPVESDFEASIAMLDMRDGTQLWVKTVEELASKDAAFDSVRDFVGTNYVIVSITEDDEATLLVLDQSTGEEIATIEGDDYIYSYAVNNGWLYVSDVDPEDGSSVIKAYKSSSLDKDPVWEYDADEYASIQAEESFLLVGSETKTEALNLTTGEPTSFSRGLDDDSWVRQVGTSLVSVEYDYEDAVYTLDVLDKDGKGTWAKPLTVDLFFVVGDMLFTAEESEDFEMTKVMRIDVKDGEDMWKSAIKGDFVAYAGPHGDRIYLFEEKRVYQINAKNGDEVQNTKIQADDAWTAESSVYASSDGELVALAKGDLKEKWALDVEDSQYARFVGQHLLLIDTEEKEIIGLK